MKGRKPLPTAIRLLAGNRSKRPINSREPKPQRGIPDCPEFLDKYAQAEWAWIIPYLDGMGMLGFVDKAVVTCYCQAWSELQHATQALRRGRTVKNGAGGTVAHPAVAQQRSAWKAIKEFAALLGLDPSSRARIKMPGADAPKNELSEFIA